MQASDFKAGDRVELHPACDLWMRGARFGTVKHVTRMGKVFVALDAFPMRTPHQFTAENLTHA